MKSQSSKRIAQVKKQLRDILISKGIADEQEIQNRIEDYLNPKRDLLLEVDPIKDRVYPDLDGMLRSMKEIVRRSRENEK
ncbi:MAG: hypothetical protein MUD08_13715 [Cytophagales bacterium]|jgi:hypothetical protein|nr:hypothetical protein [Cytophagales bacterium]